MRTFWIVWFGQLISIVGSGLTNFALGVWVYRTTGSATEFALISVAAMLPGIVVAPLAGAIVDRYDRRKVMILSDCAAGLSTLAIVLLLLSGNLQVWHIYLSAMVSSSASAFQMPAYGASTTLLVPKKHLARVSGLTQMSEAISLILAPAMAGLLVPRIGLEGVILIDVVTFVFAVGTLIIVRFPAVPVSEARKGEKSSIWSDMSYGWRYLRARKGMFWLLMYFTTLNFTFSFVNVLITPMVLSFSDESGLGFVLAMLGAGLLIGSLVMSAWGGPRRKMHVVYAFGIAQTIALMLTGVRADVALISFAMFAGAFGGPIVNGSMRTLMQTKIAPDVQGRVFSMTRMLATAAMPIAFLLAGPLADHMFEPLMRAGGGLANSVGAIIGVGEGRGIGLMFILAGGITLVATAAAYIYPRIRNLEDELPDATPDTPPQPAAVELERATAV